MNYDPTMSARKPANADLPSQTSPPHHIIVVDDEPSIRQLNTALLSNSGYEVDSAEDGAAAWEALGAGDYDLIITDNNMPNMTGFELLKKLRAARMALPVIMATGTLPTEEFTRYPWLKPDATLLKPYTVAEMLRTVKKVLREADTASASWQRPPDLPQHILVVDEDCDLRLLYTDALARPGYHVDGAEDGAAGWKALQASNYNLLITENDLPDLSGVELVRKLRAARMALPVVMATGRLPTDALARNPSLQLAATLVKPFAIDALLNTVNNVLRATITPRDQINPPGNRQSQPSAVGLQF